MTWHQMALHVWNAPVLSWASLYLVFFIAWTGLFFKNH